MAVGAAVLADGLTKDYGGGRGLFDLRLEIGSGDVVGYLGPNGAGKTTTIKCLMGMIRPTAGRAEIFGLDCQKQATAVKRKVGYLPGELAQFGGLSGAEVVGYLGGLRGGFDRSIVKRIAERFDLDLGRRYREYSRGNKQKLGICLAFMHHPQLLILDEPTGGLDPLNQQEFYRLVVEAKAEGATVFLSSHILSEVEHVCDRVAIIRHGRLVKVAEMDELHDMRMHRVEIRFAGPAPVDALRAVPGVEGVTLEDGMVTFTLQGGFDPLLRAIGDTGVTNLISHEPSLEEIFLAYYKDEAAPQAAEPVA